MGSGVALTEVEREALVQAFYDTETSGGWFGRPECEEFADAFKPAVERIVAARVERALAEQRAGIAAAIEDNAIEKRSTIWQTEAPGLVLAATIARSYRQEPTDG